ncbi:hypothetical protein ES703_65002 [subsurface metagenome]
MVAARVTLKPSLTMLAKETATPPSPRVAPTSRRPSPRRGGAIKISPAMATKLNWKAAPKRMGGSMPTITAAAKASEVMAVRCRPSSSALKKRLAIIAPRTTGGCSPVRIA